MLSRPRLRLYHNFEDARIRQLILDLDSVAMRVVIGEPPAAAIIAEDPKDDPVILTAVAGEAEVICTLDRHLHSPHAIAYCSQCGIRIMTDIELIDALRMK